MRQERKGRFEEALKKKKMKKESRVNEQTVVVEADRSAQGTRKLAKNRIGRIQHHYHY